MLFLIPVLLLLLHLTYGSAASDGSWGEWSEWTSCTVSCGSGSRKRFRACDPAPGVGGRWCQGKYLQMEDCDTGLPCPVAGGWSNWSQWSACSSTCGQGTAHRYRSCSNPLPMVGGKPCSGSPQESDSCVARKACPRDGKWSQWSQWSSCSVTCGDGGSIHRYRACNNPPPQAEGKPCEGPSRDTQGCDANQPCPVNGQWTEWTKWTECSVSCGKGERMRRRACDDPPPQHGGRDCNRTEAGELQIQSCTAKIVLCPVDGGWSEWSTWGACHSSDCKAAAGLSRSFRQRSCNAPIPANNGSMCQGTFLDAGLCSQPVNCKVDGGWGEWSSWSCTSFVASRKRLCNSPPPSRKGKNCKGKETEIFLKGEDKEEYSEACPQFSSDDEDLGGPGSGSGQGNTDEEVEDDD